MKKGIAAILMIVMILTVFASCGKSEDSAQTTQTEAQSSAEQTGESGTPTDNTDFDARFGKVSCNGKDIALGDSTTLSMFAEQTGAKLKENNDLDYGRDYYITIRSDSDRKETQKAEETFADGVTEQQMVRITTNDGVTTKTPVEGLLEFPGGLKTGTEFNKDVLEKLGSDYAIKVTDKNNKSSEYKSIDEALAADYKDISIVYQQFNDKDEFFALNSSYYSIVVKDGRIVTLQLYRDAVTK